MSINVLMVCHGNICRSPVAEAILQKMVDENKSDVKVDSAGMISIHQGEKADRRSTSSASKRGYKVTSISRPFIQEDFKRFDHILVMDDNNLGDIHALDKNEEYRDKVCKITDYCQNSSHTFVPDPYYGDGDGFNLVIDILEDACEQFFQKIK